MNDANAERLIQILKLLTDELTALRMEVHRLGTQVSGKK